MAGKLPFKNLVYVAFRADLIGQNPDAEEFADLQFSRIPKKAKNSLYGILNGYRFILESKEDDISNWRCSQHWRRGCNAKMSTIDKKLCSPIPHHNHEVQLSPQSGYCISYQHCAQAYLRVCRSISPFVFIIIEPRSLWLVSMNIIFIYVCTNHIFSTCRNFLLVAVKIIIKNLKKNGNFLFFVTCSSLFICFHSHCIRS